MAEGDFNLATLWLPVTPETSKVGPALEQAGKEAKAKFEQSVRGIGDPLDKEIAKAGERSVHTLSGIGAKIKDVFHRAGNDSGRSFSDSLSPGLNRIKGVFSRVAGDAGKAFEGGLGPGLDATKAKLDGLGGVARTLGGDLSSVTGPLDDIRAKLDEAGKNAEGSGNKISEFAGKVGDAGKKAEGFGGKLGEVGGKVSDYSGRVQTLIGTMEALDDPKLWDIPGMRQLGGMFDDLAEKGRQLGDALHFPDLSHWQGFQKLYGNKGPTADTDESGRPLFKSGVVSPLPPPPFKGPVPNTLQGQSPGATNFYKQQYPGAFTSGSGDSGGTDWEAIAQAESSGNWGDMDSSHTGHYGGLQFDLQTWADFGGLKFAKRPDLASKEQQLAVANAVPVDQRPSRWAQTWWTQTKDSGSSSSSRSSSSGGSTRSSSSGGSGRMSAPSSRLARSGSLPNVRGAHEQLAYALGAAQSMFPDLQLTAGKDDHPMDQGWHPRGQAIDIGGGTPEEQAQLSNWLLQYAPYIEELIHSGPGVTQNIKSGKLTPAIDMSGSVYNSGQAGYHGDHVHLAIKDDMAAAFEAALGGGGDGRSRPMGSKRDPLYVSSADEGTGGESSSTGPWASQGQQLGQGLINGVLQMFGIDGSVFGGKSPLDWGAVKLGGGLLNWGMQQVNSLGSSGGGMPTSGGGGLLSGVGAMITAAAAPAGGSIGVNRQTGNGVNVTHDNSINITNPTGDPYAWLQNTQWWRNSQGAALPGSSGRTNLTPLPPGPGG